ncbi:MAG: hypothetical protein ACRDWA_07935 [Acidimicrobiia bacterium]
MIRSPAARLLAERALLRLLDALGDHDVPIVVLGGLVPEVLTRNQEPPAPQHLGTTDVDIHLGLGLQPDAVQDLGVLEEALVEAGFKPDEGTEGWRWDREEGGQRVKIEFLCELDNQQEEAIVRPVGCDRLRAVNLRGTAYVTEDFQWEELSGKLDDDATVARRVRFAGLEGYLMSKIHVTWRRGAPKDYYDLVYTLLYNRLGGAEGVADVFAAGRFRKRIDLASGPWPEIRARFTKATDIGPESYANQAVQADPATDRAQARQDAVGAVAGFLDRLARGLAS